MAVSSVTKTYEKTVSFTGKDPEPRPDLRSGHIPNSYSLPFSECVRPQTSENGASYTVINSPDELRAAAQKALGSNLDAVLSHQRQVVNTCGSGMTAAVLWLTLQQLGVESAIYDEVCCRIFTHCSGRFLTVLPVIIVMDGLRRSTHDE